MGLLVMNVGPLGGGKTTRAAWRVLDWRQRFPWCPRVGNVQMDGIIYISDIMRFLATKFVHDGNKPGLERMPMLVIVDEANTSGLEARGSGSTPGDTTVFQFARKLRIHCEVISQLMSMTDKRPIWLSHFYVLCKALFNDYGDSTMFEYKIYDQGYKYQKTQYLRFKFCEKWIFPKFDTWGIPNYDKIAIELIRRHGLNTDDFEDYSRIVQQHVNLTRAMSRERDKWLARRWNNFWEPLDVNQQMTMPEIKQV